MGASGHKKRLSVPHNEAKMHKIDNLMHIVELNERSQHAYISSSIRNPTVEKSMLEVRQKGVTKPKEK